MSGPKQQDDLQARAGRRARRAAAQRTLLESFRATVHQSPLVHVEDTGRAGAEPPPVGYENNYQVALTYLGLFAYGTGRRNWLIDANRTLFISPGWEFFEEHPLGIGHAAVLLTPSRELLDEICGGPGPNKNSAFMEASHPSTMRLHLLTQQILHLGAFGDDPLAKDEWVIRALQEAMRMPTRAFRTSRAVDRAKQLLNARAGERLHLGAVATEVGVSPVYLTQEFTRCEGIPLYRYQLRLRLTRALCELPHCNDITGLALDLGFSSHAHFTAAFRKAFGLTPSDYRSTIGSRQLQFKEAFSEHERSWCAA
jgi:AraC family transcriptional regulator